MLLKKERIPRKKFNELFKNSKILSRGSFFVVRGSESPTFSAAVVISKKIAKKATERNHIKRMMYALISGKNKENKAQNKSSTGSYIIIFQKKPIQFNDLKADFDEHLFL